MNLLLAIAVSGFTMFNGERIPDIPVAFVEIDTGEIIRTTSKKDGSYSAMLLRGRYMVTVESVLYTVTQPRFLTVQEDEIKTNIELFEKDDPTGDTKGVSTTTFIAGAAAIGILPLIELLFVDKQATAVVISPSR